MAIQRNTQDFFESGKAGTAVLGYASDIDSYGYKKDGEWHWENLSGVESREPQTGDFTFVAPEPAEPTPEPVVLPDGILLGHYDEANATLYVTDDLSDPTPV